MTKEATGPSPFRRSLWREAMAKAKRTKLASARELRGFLERHNKHICVQFSGADVILTCLFPSPLCKEASLRVAARTLFAKGVLSKRLITVLRELNKCR